MPSTLEICNRALALVGSSLITALTDAATPAVVCNAEYQACVDDLLHGHDWNFASVRAALLAQVATGPAWRYAFAYQLPTDCLRVRETSADEQAGGDGAPWQVEGRTIVTDLNSFSIRYTARALEGIFPPAFATAVAYELASRIAYPLTGKAGVAELNAKLASIKLTIAKGLDGQEGSPRPTIASTLVRVRR